MVQGKLVNRHLTDETGDGWGRGWKQEKSERKTVNHIYLDLYLLDMTGLVAWIMAGAGGTNIDYGAVSLWL